MSTESDTRCQHSKKIHLEIAAFFLSCFWDWKKIYTFFPQKTHQAAVQVTQKAEQMMTGNHYNSEVVRSIAENVTTRWQQLMYHAEERLKLVMASMNWYKTAEQVRAGVECRMQACRIWTCRMQQVTSKMLFDDRYKHLMNYLWFRELWDFLWFH